MFHYFVWKAVRMLQNVSGIRIDRSNFTPHSTPLNTSHPFPTLLYTPTPAFTSSSTAGHVPRTLSLKLVYPRIFVSAGVSALIVTRRDLGGCGNKTVSIAAPANVVSTDSAPCSAAYFSFQLC